MKRVPLSEKKLLNPSEAAKHFKIGEKRLRQHLEDQPNAEYILYYGKRRLIDRERFEKAMRKGGLL